MTPAAQSPSPSPSECSVRPAGVESPQPALTKDECESSMAQQRYINGAGRERPMPKNNYDSGIWMKAATFVTPVLISVVTVLLASGWLVAPAKQTDLEALTLRFDLWSQSATETLNEVKQTVKEAKAAADAGNRAVIDMERRIAIWRAGQVPQAFPVASSAAPPAPPPAQKRRVSRKRAAKGDKKKQAGSFFKLPW